MTVMASPSFSHRCATSVRSWLSSATTEATPRAKSSGFQPKAKTLAISIHDQMNPPSSSSMTRGRRSPSGGRRRNSGLIASALARCQVRRRIGGMIAPSGTSTAKRNSNATGARIAIMTNSGRLHGFIRASGRYSGSSTVPYWVRLWCSVCTCSYMKDGVSIGMPTSAFHAPRKPGSAPFRKCEISWMNRSAR